MFKRYVASKRHTMQVDFDNYLYELGKELKAGAARARAAGFRLPVTPRARQLAAGSRGMSAVGRELEAGARQRRRTAAAILDAAREVFAELGYDAAGVRDVIRRTELASGTFYNYFPDKEAVFRAVVDESAQEVRRRLRAVRATAATLEEFVGDAYRALVRVPGRGPADVRADAAQRRADPGAVRRSDPRAPGSRSCSRI